MSLAPLALYARRATRMEFELDCICQSVVLAESPKIECGNHELKVVAYSLEFKVERRGGGLYH